MFLRSDIKPYDYLYYFKNYKLKKIKRLPFKTINIKMPKKI